MTEKEIIESTFENALILGGYRISDSQKEFLRSLQKYYKKNHRLTEKQYKILLEIREYNFETLQGKAIKK